MQDARVFAGIKAVADALEIDAIDCEGSFGLLQGIAVRCGVVLDDDATLARRIFHGEDIACQPNKRRRLAQDVTNGTHHSSLPLAKQAKQITDSSEQAAAQPSQWQRGQMLHWMLRPCTTQQFVEHYLDQRPLHIKRHKHQHYFDGLLTKADIQQLLKTQKLQYGINVDVTCYSNGRRTNLNHNSDSSSEEHEIAKAATVMRRFSKEGCSVRILHPQRWVEPVYKLLSLLEDELRSPVGCNAYLTPPASQGFAPHWDDIDAFVLQVEGYKRWRLYAPSDPADLLPRNSSRDFDQEELGKLLLDVILQPGDVLYMPRGCIHQAEALEEAHSLHLTVSANQHCTWADLFELLLPRALQLASDECISLRKSLPLDMSQHMGLLHEETASSHRRPFQDTSQQLLQKVLQHVPLDAAADRLNVQFIQQRLPPHDVDRLKERPDLEISDTSSISLVRPGVAALAVEDDAVVLYHCLDNPRILHAARRGDSEGDSDSEHTRDGAGRLEFQLECGEVLERIMLSAAPGAMVSVGKLEELLEDAAVDISIFDVIGELYNEGLINVEV